MRLSLRKAIVVAGAAGLLSVLAACGSSSNNDQGMSFTLFGFFKSADIDQGDAGQIVQLSTDAESNGSAGGARTFVGIQNNLVGQGFRTQRSFLSFYIEGAQIQPPDTTQPFSAVLGPVSADGEVITNPDGSSSSLPDGWAGLANQRFVETFIVPPDVMAWINLNRNQLPEPPFTMSVHIYVTGLTTSGSRLDSNGMDYFVQFVPDNVVSPSTDSDSSSSEAATESETTTEDVEILE